MNLLLIAAAAVAMNPDYAGIALPPNVAPLNFDLDRDATVTLTGGRGRLEKRGREIRFGAEEWREFLDGCRGSFYELAIRPADGSEPLVATNSVADAPMDAYLSYRLIAPSYGAFDAMGIYQRNLTNFEEKPIYRNVQYKREQCINCHTYRRADPDTFLFHKRASGAGTVIAHPKYGLHKYTIKPDHGTPGNGTYPAWHPSGEYVAFSINETRQSFFLGNDSKIEVADLQSDLALYVIGEKKLITIEDEPEVFECFPTWSQDGRVLYSSRAKVPFKVSATNEDERLVAVYSNVRKIRYDLVARDFDEKTRTFGEPRVILDSNRLSASFLFPRVSPDGRWLLVTAASFGVFPIWHREADLFIVDLKTLSIRSARELNSADSDSYHTFSSDGKWVVFSSRRLDGSYTRPFFAAFDAASGRFSKPFLIPVKDPVEHERRFLSYNIPEFATGPVKYSPDELRAAD